MIDYDPHRWRTTFFSVRGSMVKVISLRAFFVTLVGLALTLVHFHVHQFDFQNPLVVHGFVGTALGLLLVFRTNASYDRWWEGRKLWGAMVNTCRNLARSASVHLASQPEALRRVIRLTQAFPEASMHALRNEGWTPTTLDGADRDAVLAKQHKPLAITQRITAILQEELRAGRLSDIVFSSMDQNAQQLMDIIGGCERIHKTPLPFAYVVHLRRALVIYCATLPVGLAELFGWASVGIVFLVAYIMLGIEEIGVEIEDPFERDDNDLPLEAITQGIQKSTGEWLPS